MSGDERYEHLVRHLAPEERPQLVETMKEVPRFAPLWKHHRRTIVAMSSEGRSFKITRKRS
jgi:hypothetical protein